MTKDQVNEAGTVVVSFAGTTVYQLTVEGFTFYEVESPTQRTEPFEELDEAMACFNQHCAVLPYI